jgi:hypothetical protein
MVAQLNKLQAEVNECHASQEGQALLVKISEHATLKQNQGVDVAAEGHKYDLRKRSEKKQYASEEECEACGEDIDDGDGCICSQCSGFAHAECHGLDSPMDAGFYCRTCIENGLLGNIDSAAVTEGGAYILNTNDDQDEYVDSAQKLPTRGKRSTSRHRYTEDQLFDEPDLLLGDDNLAEWVSENQVNDEDRRKLVLLSLPTGKTWSARDLENEHHLRVGLLLLFNLIQGKDDLTMSRSIHINYSQLTKKARDHILKRMELSKSMEKRQEKLAGSV